MSKPKSATATLLILALAACGIPDLKPFGDATAEMASVLGAAYSKTQSALHLAAATSRKTQAFTDASQTLDKNWALTHKAIAALVDYSDSLAALAEAGKKGQETVARLTGAVSNLASSVGALPLAPAAMEIVKLVGGKIIELKAEKDIRKAVVHATEAVNLLAPILRQNFIDLAATHDAAVDAWRANVLVDTSAVINYHESLVAEEQRLQYLLTLILQYQSAPDRLRYKAALARAGGRPERATQIENSIPEEMRDNLIALKASDTTLAALDPASSSAPATVEARQRQLMELINAQRKEIAVVEPKFQAAAAERARVEEAQQNGDAILNKAADAIDAWQSAHKSLRATVDKQQSRPSIAQLVSILKEIAALTK